ncbi:MAG: hypothetical protein HDR93_07765 [Bacteroides sp.]|nr:hypothetical protein [Bacteroides sp.]
MGFLSDLKSGSNFPTSGSYEFKSSDHIRFQNGQDVSGHNYNCHRTVRIESNIEGGAGYTVSILNDDSIHPLWGNNIQMAPKPMKVVSIDHGNIVLRGYGTDRMGACFADYALTIVFENDEIQSCILHMIDRNVDLMYLK